MAAFHIIIVALAQSSLAGGGQPAANPDIEVVGPQRQVICRSVTMSNSRIPVRRICQTQAQLAEQMDQQQADADRAVGATTRRTNEAQQNSGYGNWIRERAERPLGDTRPR